MAQSLARLWTHLIFSTKDRFPFLTDKSIRSDMHAYLATILRKYGCETLIVGGVEDHTHSLFALSRIYPIAQVVKETKRTSSGWVKGLSPKLAKFHWQGGYAAFSVSQSNLKDVIAYIENQEEHHKRVTFQMNIAPFSMRSAWNTTNVMFGIDGLARSRTRAAVDIHPALALFLALSNIEC